MLCVPDASVEVAYFAAPPLKFAAFASSVAELPCQSRQLLAFLVRSPALANIPWTALQLQNKAPIAVPSVLVMISVVPESRVGRKACKISMLRLTVNPRMIVANTPRLISEK